MEDNFSTDGGGGDGSGDNASNGGVADEASLIRLPLTSCCVAQAVARGLGTPALGVNSTPGNH